MHFSLSPHVAAGCRLLDALTEALSSGSSLLPGEEHRVCKARSLMRGLTVKTRSADDRSMIRRRQEVTLRNWRLLTPVQLKGRVCFKK